MTASSKKIRSEWKALTWRFAFRVPNVSTTGRMLCVSNSRVTPIYICRHCNAEVQSPTNTEVPPNRWTQRSGIFPFCPNGHILQSWTLGAMRESRLGTSFARGLDFTLSARSRRIRVYRITPRGRKRLQREVSSFERMLTGIARVMRPSES